MNDHQMSLSPEFAPLQRDEGPRPQLELIQGGAEGGQPDSIQPELYAVPDAETPEQPDSFTGADGPVAETPEAADSAETDHEVADLIVMSVPRRRKAAKTSGKIVTEIAAGTVADVRAGTTGRMDRRRGGGMAYREYLRKLEAKEAEKNHKSSCREAACEYCSA
jgi:hypothetical protein